MVASRIGAVGEVATIAAEVLETQAKTSAIQASMANVRLRGTVCLDIGDD
jgi:hypothetical protein